MSIKGEIATDIMNELCKRIRNYHANDSEVSASFNTQQPNELSDDAFGDIEELKLSQQTTTEAIQSLSDSILLITSQFQEFVNKNKSVPDSPMLPKQSCVSELTHADADSAEVDNSFVIQESTSPPVNNWDITRSQPINQSNSEE